MAASCRLSIIPRSWSGGCCPAGKDENTMNDQNEQPLDDILADPLADPADEIAALTDEVLAAMA